MLLPAIVSLGWIGAVIWGLNRAGFWNPDLWWDTVAFALVGATSLVWRAADSKDFSRHFYAHIAAQTLGLSVVAGTIASTYTFSLPIELFLVPWLVLLGGIQAVAASSALKSLRAHPGALRQVRPPAAGPSGACLDQ